MLKSISLKDGTLISAEPRTPSLSFQCGGDGYVTLYSDGRVEYPSTVSEAARTLWDCVNRYATGWMKQKDDRIAALERERDELAGRVTDLEGTRR